MQSCHKHKFALAVTIPLTPKERIMNAKSAFVTALLLSSFGGGASVRHLDNAPERLI